VLDVNQGDSELATGFQASPTKALSQGYLLLGSQCHMRIGK